MLPDSEATFGECCGVVAFLAPSRLLRARADHSGLEDPIVREGAQGQASFSALPAEDRLDSEMDTHALPAGERVRCVREDEASANYSEVLPWLYGSGKNRRYTPQVSHATPATRIRGNVHAETQPNNGEHAGDAGIPLSEAKGPENRVREAG